ncbi:heme transporter CcmA [Gallibacterium anatis]|uniref:Heme transporter CcmA n=1 Tax=Gallibacterium anatis TaxID=750 RepID=A0A930Y4S8_9PAST|nr:heme transporter CcmA [Gallibacterium anatis]
MPFLRNLGVGMIGNNPNAVSNTSNLSILEAHSDANQNINNLKFVYDENDKDSVKKWIDTLDILNKTHQNGIRKFNTIGENK